MDYASVPIFFRTVPNFDGPSRENYEVFWDAELYRIPNPVPILSQCECECNITSHVDKLYSYSPNRYTEFVVVRCVHSSSKCIKSIFGRSSTLDPAGKAYDAPPDPLVGWEGATPCPSLLDAFSVSNTVPNFCHRFYTDRLRCISCRPTKTLKKKVNRVKVGYKPGSKQLLQRQLQQQRRQQHYQSGQVEVNASILIIN